MKAVILAAGKSTRAYPLTVEKPKALLKVMNKTIIEHNLEQLKGIADEAVIVVGFMKEMIMQKLGSSYSGIKISYIEQKEILGTGHAVLQAKGIAGDRFIVMMGDDLISGKDIKKIAGLKYALLAKEVEDITRFGICESKDGRLVRIIEKPKKSEFRLANTACYSLSSEIFSIIEKTKKSERGEIEIVDAISEIAKKEEVIVKNVEDYWIPIGYPWDLIEANSLLVGKIGKTEIKGIVEPGVQIKGNIVVGEGTVLMSGTYIEGNAAIGRDCRIGPNCYIRGNTSIGNGCRIGQAVEIKNSIIGDKSNVPHLNYVGDSVIGDGCNLGAGTIAANLRHDHGNIKSEVKGALVDTGRHKMGAIIGDNVHTAINTSIYPGRKIWPGNSTAPGEIVKKDINQEVKK